jgi:hypothetical protein
MITEKIKELTIIQITRLNNDIDEFFRNKEKKEFILDFYQELRIYLLSNLNYSKYSEIIIEYPSIRTKEFPLIIKILIGIIFPPYFYFLIYFPKKNVKKLEDNLLRIKKLNEQLILLLKTSDE